MVVLCTKICVNEWASGFTHMITNCALSPCGILWCVMIMGHAGVHIQAVLILNGFCSLTSTNR